MGQSTFNLTEFFNRLGIKNPQPTMLESVQPVILAGDFSGLTPQNHPPMDIFGSDISNVAGEFSMVQVRSRDPGGCYIAWTNFNGLVPVYGRVDPAVTGLTPLAGSGPYSNDPLLTTVEVGTDPVLPFTRAVLPTWPAINLNIFPSTTTRIYLPNGAVFVTARDTVALALLNWSMCIVGVPASESPV